jgi:DNA-binding MarR family transcriptional regulator
MRSAEALDEFVENLRKVFFALRAVSNDMLADLDCTVVERGILKDVAGGALTVPQLADNRAVSRQAMQKAVDALVVRKLVALESNPRHRRSPLVAITRTGSKLLDAARAREKKLIGSVELPISETQLKQTTRVLTELAEHFTALPRRMS